MRFVGRTSVKGGVCICNKVFKLPILGGFISWVPSTMDVSVLSGDSEQSCAMANQKTKNRQNKTSLPFCPNAAFYTLPLKTFTMGNKQSKTTAANSRPKQQLSIQQSSTQMPKNHNFYQIQKISLLILTHPNLPHSLYFSTLQALAGCVVGPAPVA